MIQQGGATKAETLECRTVVGDIVRISWKEVRDMRGLCQTGNVFTVFDGHVALVSRCTGSEPANIGPSSVSATGNVLVDTVHCFAQRIFVFLIVGIEHVPGIGCNEKSGCTIRAEGNDALQAIEFESGINVERDCHFDDKRVVTICFVEATARLADSFLIQLTITGKGKTRNRWKIIKVRDCLLRKWMTVVDWFYLFIPYHSLPPQTACLIDTRPNWISRT